MRTVLAAAAIAAALALVPGTVTACAGGSTGPSKSRTSGRISKGPATPITVSGTGLTISATGVAKPVLTATLAEAQVARGWVQRTWPGQLRAFPTLRVQVAADDADFTRLRGSTPPTADVAATTTSDGRVVLAPAARSRLTSRGTQVVLAHEFTHAVLRQTSRTGVPRWIIEGSAEFSAYRYAGASLRAACPDLVSERRQDDTGPSVPPTDGAFVGATGAVAYQQAHAYSAFLVHRYGLSAWQRFVLAVGAGSDVDQALRMLTGSPSTGALRTAYDDFLRTSLA